MPDGLSDDLLRRFKRAMETHDVDGLIATMSPDVVLRSPITSRVTFTGHGELRELMQIHFAVVEDVRYRDDELVYTGTVRRQPVEVVNRLAPDGAGRIGEVTVYVRPLPGLAALAAGLGPRLARRRRTRAHALAMRCGLELTLALTAGGDRLAKRFV